MQKFNKYLIWASGVSFVLFQFFIQLSSGVVIGAIMHEQNLSGFMAGLLGSALYFVYTTLQIPVGVLFDIKSTRFLFTINPIICGIGCFIFSYANTLTLLFIGRLFIGTGSAFAFVGLSHLLRSFFPLRSFGFMLGLSETLGFVATMLGMLGMGQLIHMWGWQYLMTIAGFVALFIAFLCCYLIPDIKHHHKNTPLQYTQQLMMILANKKAWLNGLFVGLSFIVITVFGAIWAIPFIQIKLQTSLNYASIMGGFLFLGAGISCPLFGYLSSISESRTRLILFSNISTAMLLLILIFMPIQSSYLTSILMFLIGICCGAYMLAFSISNELAPKNCLSACTGFTNTLAMISATIYPPITGYLLDFFQNTCRLELITAYKLALLFIPLSILAASIISAYLPEKHKMSGATPT